MIRVCSEKSAPENENILCNGLQNGCLKRRSEPGQQNPAASVDVAQAIFLSDRKSARSCRRLAG